MRARNWVNIVSHIVFGAVVVWWYKTRAHPAEEYATR